MACIRGGATIGFSGEGVGPNAHTINVMGRRDPTLVWNTITGDGEMEWREGLSMRGNHHFVPWDLRWGSLPVASTKWDLYPFWPIMFNEDREEGG